MTHHTQVRIRAYKNYLVRRIRSLKGSAYKIALKRPTAKEIFEYVSHSAPGVAFSNIARDIRMLTEPGDRYDPEFDLLWRGQVLPEVVERYSETYLARLIKGVIAPSDLDRVLSAETLKRIDTRTRPDGRPLYDPQ